MNHHDDQLHDDGPTDAEIAGEVEIRDRLVEAAKPQPAWQVTEAGANSTGQYYRLNVRTTGGLIAPVLVKHSTRFNTMICLTCNTADRCAHARFVRRAIERATVLPGAA